MLTKKMLCSVILLYTLLVLYQTPSVTGCDRLFLTPYIQQGNLTTAKELSFVDDTEGIIPRSHAGYITVDQNVGNHLFFWFFPTLNSNSSAPLLIWLNGGPGESSIIGLLLENGPIQLGKSSSGEDIYIRRNNSWVDKFSMLYIDNPVGTGLSYTKNVANGSRFTQDGFAQDLYEFLKQFYQMFPEFLQIDLYIGGQSYAGKYVPAFAQRIHQENSNGELKIPLKGIYLGAPLIDFLVQTVESLDLYYNLGYITFVELEEFKNNITKKLPLLKNYFYENVFPLLYRYVSDNFNMPEIFNTTEMEAVMTSENVRSLLHVGNVIFLARNYFLFQFIWYNDLIVSSGCKLPELMEHYKVLIYGGDLDGRLSASGLEKVLRSLQWSLRSAYNNSRRVAWIGQNGKQKGFYTRISNFCRVVIRGAGHRTGFDQPDNTLEMMDQFVTNGCLS